MRIAQQAVARLIERAAGILESRRGRRALWAYVTCTFAVAGVWSVIRAELPRRKLVEKPVYASPVEIGERQDSQSVWLPSEFRGYRQVAWGTVVTGIDPYADLEQIRAYTPFFAIVFLPFAALWQIRFAGSALYLLVNVSFALMSCWCASRWLRRPGEEERFGVFALILILLSPLLLDVMMPGESDLLVLFPVSLAFLFLAQGRREFGAGALLGFAASLKLIPALFAVYLLCRRQWRAASGMVAVGVFCSVILPAAVLGPARAWELYNSWYRHVLAPYAVEGESGIVRSPTYAPTNQSPGAAVGRYFAQRPGERALAFAALSPGTVGQIAHAIGVLVGAGLVAFWTLSFRREETAAKRAVLLATVPLGMLLMSQVSLVTHHVLFLLPIAVLVVRTVDLQDAWARRWAWVLPVYMLVFLAMRFRAVKVYTPFLAVTVLFLVACIALAVRELGSATTQQGPVEGRP